MSPEPNALVPTYFAYDAVLSLWKSREFWTDSRKQSHKNRKQPAKTRETRCENRSGGKCSVVFTGLIPGAGEFCAKSIEQQHGLPTPTLVAPDFGATGGTGFVLISPVEKKTRQGLGQPIND